MSPNVQICVRHVVYWGGVILAGGDSGGGDYQHMGMSATEYDALRTVLVGARRVRGKAGLAAARKELAKRAPVECRRRYAGKTPRPVWG